MKTTITEEYEDGQLIRRTTVTDGDYATGGYVGPAPVRLPGLGCTCGQPWGSVTAPPPCPVHGQSWPATITCSANVTPGLAPPLPGSSTQEWQTYWDQLAGMCR